MSHGTDFAAARAALVEHLAGQGIADPRVLAAMGSVPRELFVPEPLRAHAYEDTALPLPDGQSISQPTVVARMSEALDVGPRMKVLEVGTGSGYQAAVLSRLARRVYSVERIEALARQAETVLADAGVTNVTTRIADGAAGWPEQAPFDRVMVTAAAPAFPDTLYAQLKTGGVMVVPVGARDGVQHLEKITRTETGPKVERIEAVRFVPLISPSLGDEENGTG